MTTIKTAWIFDSGEIVKADSPSQQLNEDPFRYREGAESGLLTPPYSLEQLAGQLETNTLHYRACKQKAADVAGRGFELKPKRDDAKEGASTAEATWSTFLESVQFDERGDESFKERIVAAHEDFESVGWGVLEVSRRADGVPDGLWHVPGHTVRAHIDGRRFAQKRGDKTVWFKRFGIEGSVNRFDGGWSATGATPGTLRGNELIVIRNPTPRSLHYGLPDHIPAMAALAGWRAQAEFNVRFFDRNAMPSYAVVLEGADFSPEVEDMIREHFEAIRGKPHATLVIPIPGVVGDEAMQPKLRFEKLSVDIKDASFRLYKQDNALEICIAHGIPPYRVGWPIMGSLGGATAEEMTQIYNDGIVQPRQETWEDRLTLTLLGAKGLNLPNYELKANELDTRNEARDIEKAKALYALDAINPEKIAAFFGLDVDDNPNGKLYRSQLGPGVVDDLEAQLVTKRWTSEVTALGELRAQVERLIAPTRATA